MKNAKLTIQNEQEYQITRIPDGEGQLSEGQVESEI